MPAEKLYRQEVGNYIPIKTFEPIAKLIAKITQKTVKGLSLLYISKNGTAVGLKSNKYDSSPPLHLPNILPQLFQNYIKINWFADMIIHPDGKAVIYILTEYIGGHCNYWNAGFLWKPTFQ